MIKRKYSRNFELEYMETKLDRVDATCTTGFCTIYPLFSVPTAKIFDLQACFEIVRPEPKLDPELLTGLPILACASSCRRWLHTLSSTSE